MARCPKCEGKCTKRSNPVKHFWCSRHGFVRKINTPSEHKEKTHA